MAQRIGNDRYEGRKPASTVVVKDLETAPLRTFGVDVIRKELPYLVWLNGSLVAYVSMGTVA